MCSFPLIFIPLDIPTPYSPHSHPIPRIPTLIPRILALIRRISTPFPTFPPHSLQSHYDSPQSHRSPHSIPRFPIPAFTVKVWENTNIQELCVS